MSHSILSGKAMLQLLCWACWLLLDCKAGKSQEQPMRKPKPSAWWLQVAYKTLPTDHCGKVALCVCLWKWLSSSFSGSTPVASWLRHVAVGPGVHGELCPWCFIPGNTKHMPNASLRKILQTSPVVPQVNSQMQPIMYSNANQVVELQFGFSY